LNLAFGEIHFEEGDLLGAAINRSPYAYRKNPDWKDYATETDPSNLVLRFSLSDGRNIGMLNWFAVHPTSMSKKNHYISSDNSGYAALLFEQTFKQANPSEKSFIAAFATSNAGDASPDIFEADRKLTDFQKTKEIGTRRFTKPRSSLKTRKILSSPVSRFDTFGSIWPIKGYAIQLQDIPLSQGKGWSQWCSRILRRNEKWP